MHRPQTLDSSWSKGKSLGSVEAPSLHDTQLTIVSFLKIPK